MRFASGLIEDINRLQHQMCNPNHLSREALTPAPPFVLSFRRRRTSKKAVLGGDHTNQWPLVPVLTLIPYAYMVPLIFFVPRS
jgi:hypothetical protein